MKIPLTPSYGEEKDLASSFLAGLFPLKDASSFKELYETFKKEHPKADHYPYAYVLGGASKSSDDGEPGGSAGRPLISLLQEQGIEGAIIIARYFGGSKLGIPRLRRAFIASASSAITNGRFGAPVSVYQYAVEVDYPTYEILQSLRKRYGFSIENAVFDINVRAQICARDTLDGLGEALGLFDLKLGHPKRITIIEEIQP